MAAVADVPKVVEFPPKLIRLRFTMGLTGVIGGLLVAFGVVERDVEARTVVADGPVLLLLPLASPFEAERVEVGVVERDEVATT